ncbi:D-2-hydroxyacid dehydrogenase [Colwellia sp. UCD-KL20]|uniref:D-2-hydroxyacid dehydrogenase n=1 Tax=Colwellia sp. UCD-KL20 TaxID=1917165 RepID=UPI0009714A2F|nr:D-2-hydroxyacid dehydrogenase [Colwellia sp. UCD-KL20]
MHAVFLDKKTFNSSSSTESINKQVNQLVCFDTTAPNKIIERCINADIIITNKVILSEKILKQLPQLKLICIAATGTNNVDLKAASRLNIAVTNVAGYAKQSVAQYVFSQILEYYNQTTHHHQNVENGLWPESDTFCVLGNPITEIANKTLGIIGYGDLGSSVEKIALAFGMKVLIAERNDAKHIRESRHSFEYVCKHADIISLHCPHVPSTEHLINAHSLALMKPSAMLINTARGAIIDNSALLDALNNKIIAYAVLDVLDCEPPPPNHMLLSNQPENLKVTAHIAWASNEAQSRLLDLVAQNIKAFINNKRVNRVD